MFLATIGLRAGELLILVSGITELGDVQNVWNIVSFSSKVICDAVGLSTQPRHRLEFTVDREAFMAMLMGHSEYFLQEVLVGNLGLLTSPLMICGLL